MAGIPAGNDPFSGGSITRTGQANVAGGIPSANTAVGNPIAGVVAGTPFSARNNRGSNITVPYARLVPLGADQNKLGRPPAYSSTELKSTPFSVSATEDLQAMKLAFVLGKRSAGDSWETPVVHEVNGELSISADTYGFGFNVNHNMAPGVPGTERFQMLCSFEYLSRYFTNVLFVQRFEPPTKLMHKTSLIFVFDRTRRLCLLRRWGKGIKLSDEPATLDPATWTSGFPRTVAAAHAQRQKDTDAGAPPNKAGGSIKDELDGKTLTQMPDLAKVLALPGATVNDVADDYYMSIYQGIFARDLGPFLRGKGLARELVDGTPKGHPAAIFDDGKKPLVQPYHVSRTSGDELAFALFEMLLEKKGLTDWRPDGIVLSKGVDDPSDKMSDEYLKARDGELYNIGIEGPAIASSWTGNPALEMMPLDKVFVIIVADVWWGDLSTMTTGIEDFCKDAAAEKLSSANDTARKKLKDYLAARKTELADKALKKAGVPDFQDRQKDTFVTNEDTHMCNFRVMLATSSQMVNYSNIRFDGSGKQVCADFDGSSDEFKRVHNQSRMGLRLGVNGGEYIVGGWCIGNVLDTSASRASFPNKGNIGVRTAPNSMAINLNVKVEWWDADRMYRSFMNVPSKKDYANSLTPRYVQSKRTLKRQAGGRIDGVLYSEVDMPPTLAKRLKHDNTGNPGVGEIKSAAIAPP